MRSNYNIYKAALAHYKNKPIVLTPRAPLSKRAMAFMGGAAFAIVAAASLVTPAMAALAPLKQLAAVGAWTFYNEGKKYLMSGGFINMGTSTFRMSLHTSASNAATATLSTFGSVTGELTEANGYSSSGKPITYTFTVGASAGQYRMNATAIIWTATGGSLANIKYAVIWVTGASTLARKLVCRSQLSTSQFTLTINNTLTISNPSGVFTVA